MDQNKKKLTVVTFLFLFFFLIVLGKAFKIQVLDKEILITKAQNQFVRKDKIYPKRGNIYDRNGFPLAINIQTYSIFTIPKKGMIDTSAYKLLSKLVPKLNYTKVIKKVRSRRKFTWLIRKVSLKDDIVLKIKKIPGIYIEAVPQRLYPGHELFAQGIGFVGIDNKGLSGIEYMFDEKLRGTPKEIKYIVDNKGRAIKLESRNNGKAAEDIYLTIDKDLQAAAEKFLKEAVIEHDAVLGGVGVMDSESGEILAMANYPTFDPNKLSGSLVKNRKLSFMVDPIEPGSTLKILTAASLLQHKMAHLDTSYYCEKGEFKVNDHIISEAGNKKDLEWLTVEEIIKYSSNIGVTKMAFDLTYTRFKKTLLDFGIGQKTGIQIPGESRGIFDIKATSVSPIRLSNISFGQGVATTGLQMMSIYSTVANGGMKVAPSILLNSKSKSHRIIDQNVAADLTKILVAAVESGTGGNARIPYFEIAGKTSTAQRVDKRGGYSGYISGFIGFPINVKKKFVIYVYIENPRGKHHYGNTVAAPVFKKIAQHVLYKNKDFDKLVESKIADEKVLQSVNIKHMAARIMGEMAIPDFVGMDKFSSKLLAEKLDILVDHVGVGVIKSQIPKAGKMLDDSTIVKLFYTPPVYE